MTKRKKKNTKTQEQMEKIKQVNHLKTSCLHHITCSPSVVNAQRKNSSLEGKADEINRAWPVNY